jgi:hypothetical protein
MLRRLVKILALPIIAAIFLVGWFLYYFGSKPQSLTKKTETTANASENQTESNADDGIEMGLIEEQTITQYTD